MTEGQDICECGHKEEEHENITEDLRHPLQSGRGGDIAAGTHKGATKCRACTGPVKCVKFRPRRTSGR